MPISAATSNGKTAPKPDPRLIRLSQRRFPAPFSFAGKTVKLAA